MGICEDVERVRRAHLNDMGRWHIPCSSLVDPDPNWIRILATIENRGKIRLDWLIKKLTILIGEFSSGAIIFVLLKEMFKLKIVIFKFAHILFKINNVTVWKRLGSGSKYLRIRIPALCQFFYHTGEVPVPLYATADGSFVLTENIFPFLTLGLLYLFTNPSLATANLLFK